MIILLFIILHWYISLYFQTFFHHRYSAHKMFTMSKFWERVFHLGAFLTQGSSYLSPRVYGILHRLHHAHADTEQDPHSPKFDKSLFKMMWRTKKIYSGIAKGKIEIADKFKQQLPEWKFIDRLGDMWVVRIAWGLAYIAFYVQFAQSAWLYLLLPAHFLMSPLHGVVVNWFAHKYGYRNFNLKDTSTNFLPVDVLMLGESYHNNHHNDSTSPNFGVRWFEVDPVFISIWVFDKLGILKVNKQLKPIHVSSK